ncbi:MAG: RNA 2',3'-cyclic phosphodiesterase [Candidatus Caldarchaeum sp.]|nr:RNA 2',3'-cyclic phosphodiesterase [Candidatus Caldarchaeum sp.]MDW8062885.1 RNA 2',3'-cyclic phosphodiesterase [Candidatus Caldarchaeum sp.]
MVRAFFAVDLEDEAVISNISSFQREVLRAGGEGLKPVERENLHITLIFLGEINEPEVAVASRALETIEAKPFEIEFRGAGYFPGGGRVNVVWVGVKAGAEELKNLHNQLKSKLRNLRLENEKFVPHVTVCRVKFIKNRNSLLEVLSKNVDTLFGKQRVEKVVLKKSVLTASGPIYSDIAVKTF